MKVLDESSGQLLAVLSTLNNIPNTSSGYWRIDIGPIYDSQRDENSYNAEICKRFILRYKTNEFDTLQTCFKSKKTKCGSVFETFKVYYKGDLVISNSNDVGANITILKR